jgi:hypothetical protein
MSRWLLPLVYLLSVSPAGFAAAVMSAASGQPDPSLTLTMIKRVESANGAVQAGLYQVDDQDGKKDANAWKQSDTWLQITTGEDTWWVAPPPVGTLFTSVEFVDDQQLLLGLSNVSYNQTAILDLDTRAMTLIGGGAGRYIRTGPDAGLIALTGRKGYVSGPSPHAIWFDLLVDLQGNIVELSPVVPAATAKCITVRAILQADKAPSRLRQSLDDCIGVMQ